MLAFGGKHFAGGMYKAGHEMMDLQDGLSRDLGETEGFAVALLKLVSERHDSTRPEIRVPDAVAIRQDRVQYRV